MEIKKGLIQIAWIHNYDRKINPLSGVFMYQLYDYFSQNSPHIKIDLINIGNLKNPLSIPFKILKYRGIFEKYDILHAQYGSGTGFFTSIFRGKKILSLRGSDWYYYPSKKLFNRLHSWLSCKLTRYSIHRFDTIIVMSERMHAELKTGFPFIKVKVIPDGIDLQKFYPARNSENSFRVLFSSINRNNLLKRFDLAEKAFNIFHNKYPDTQFVFMNGVPHDKVNELINSVNVILLTSTHEGWPNIIKEGLACNVPFVSTDVSDLRSIAESTDTCFICEDDAESLAEGLVKVFLRKEKEDLRYFAAQFDTGLIGENLIHLYRE